MKAMKFRVENEQHSEAIQEALFKLGYKWGFTDIVSYTLAPFLYAEIEGHICHGVVEDVYIKASNEECKLFCGEIIPVTQLTERPPLGLRPKHVVQALRRKEILEAIARYVEASKSVPNEWLEEFKELNV